MTKATKVLIATPAINGSITTTYVRSLVELVRLFERRGILHAYRLISMADIELARDLLASTALHESCSHLLFIDADIGFEPAVVEKMLDIKKEFVSTIYPRRTLNLESLIAAVAPNESEGKISDDLALSRALAFVGNVVRQPGPKKLKIRHGFCEVDTTGMGLCLLQTTVLQKMMLADAVSKLIFKPGDWDVPDFPVYGFFDKIVDSEGSRLSEDYSFCRRWSDKCGGKIWACVSEPITHVGNFEFRGRFLDKLMHVAKS